MKMILIRSGRSVLGQTYGVHLFIALLSKRKLVVAAKVACVLLVNLGVGFLTGCNR